MMASRLLLVLCALWLAACTCNPPIKPPVAEDRSGVIADRPAQEHPPAGSDRGLAGREAEGPDLRSAGLSPDLSESVDQTEWAEQGAVAAPKALAAAWAPPPDALAAKLAIHFLNVGQGDATLVVCPNGKRILIDAGTLPYPRPTEIESLRAQLHPLLDPAKPEIDVVVVTHPDQDHFSLLPSFLRGVVFRQLILIGAASEYTDEDHSDPPRYHNAGTWLRRLREDFGHKVTVLERAHGKPYRDPEGTPSSRFECGTAKIWILAAEVREDLDFPQEDALSGRNTRSIVLKITHGAFDAILTADATFRTEAAIVSAYTPEFLDVELLKIGHHGSATTSTSASWANATTPAVAVASAGYRSPHEHPRREPLRRLEPHTEAARHHSIRWYERNNGPPVDRHDYAEAIFNTATSGRVVVYSDGTSGGDGRANWWYEHD